MNSRVQSLVQLGSQLDDLCNEALLQQAHARNAWFIPENVRLAVQGICHLLDKTKLEKFVDRYPKPLAAKRVGLVLAGNIPMVGFHDILCVLLSGHAAHVKLSSSDDVLIPAIVDLLADIDESLAANVVFVDKINEVDAVIATGSDNTARYFEYYFRKLPHIIRKNRTSVAILSGEETDEELLGLGHDILHYFGLGCRNVSKIWVPDAYNFDQFYEAIQTLHPIIHTSKYVNNYDYNKSIFLINNDTFLDNGFLLVKEDEGVVSPISTVYYESYTHLDEVETWISTNQEKIQVVVAKPGTGAKSIAFGTSQQPDIWDFADNVDTMTFLSRL